MQKVVKKL